MSTTGNNLKSFEVPLRSEARTNATKTQFLHNEESTPVIHEETEDDCSFNYNNYLASSSPRDSIFSISSSACGSSQQSQEDHSSHYGHHSKRSVNDADLEDFEGVQICTITDIIVISKVHLQNDAKPFYVTL